MTPETTTETTARRAVISFKPLWILGLVLVLAVGAFAWSRVGLFDLPSVPGDITLSAAGLDGLPAMKQLDDAFHAAGVLYAPGAPEAAATIKLSPAADSVRMGLMLIQANHPEEGLEQIRKGVRSDPTNLVLSNAYRMAVFHLRRDLLIKQQTNPTIAFPQWLDHAAKTVERNKPERSEPISFLLASTRNIPAARPSWLWHWAGSI